MDRGHNFADRFREDELVVFESLNEQHVPYVVDGGVGCLFHGARKFDASLNDIDVILRPDIEAATKIIQALSTCASRLGFSWSAKPEDAAEPKKQFKFLHGMFDFRTSDSAEQFDQMYGNSSACIVKGHKITLISIADLIKIKSVAANTAATEQKKHTDDIAILLRLAG